MEVNKLINFADISNGTNRRVFPTDEQVKYAKENNLVFVYGASDDLMEVDGMINDEFGCYDGGTAIITEKGLIESDWDVFKYNAETEEEFKEYFKNKETGKEIKALWCEVEDYSWAYSTEIPHLTFDIKEDGDNYCRGIVFSIDDLK